MPNALITGGSKGLGLALATALAARGWDVHVDARHEDELDAAVAKSGFPERFTAVPGDISDASHRARLVESAGGPIDLVVNNASTLGPAPMPELLSYPVEAFERVLQVNLIAPLALVQSARSALAPGAAIVNVTSDAAVEPYEGWGGYGSSKAALEQLTAILGAENPDLFVYAFDPGDMRTEMHQAAFPGEDISDRPEPADIVPSLLAMIERRPPSGRYTSRSFVLSGAAS
jgi:NAD(P)-dependent dehydrogenase (short-subunit alcohol dehydrogenase family)